MRTIGIRGLGLLVTACSAATDDSASSASDLATTTTGIACSEVVTTDDGAFAVYAQCPGGPTGRLVRMAVATGRTSGFADYSAQDRILKVGTAGKLLYWATAHADGTRDFSVAEIRDQVGPPAWVSAVSAPVTIPLRDVAERLDVLVTKSRTILIAGKSADGVGQSLVVARPDSSTPVLEAKLGTSGSSPVRMWPGSNERTVAITDYWGTSWQLLNLAGLTLGPTVRMQGPPGMTLWEAVPDSFDGSSFIARARTNDNDHPIVRVRVDTGAVDTLASGFDQSGSLWVRDGYLWHTSRRKVATAEVPAGSWSLESFRRNGGPVRTIATDPDGLDAAPSHDGSGVVFVAGARSGFDVNALGVAPADGTSPARIVVTKDEKLALKLRPADDVTGGGANRQIVEVRNNVTRERSLRLIDEASGTTLGSWREQIDYDVPFRVRLSANGAALFAEKSCNSIGGGPHGTLVMQLWPSVTPMTSCNTAAIDYDVAVPGSSALVYVTYPQPLRTVTVVRP